MNSLYDLWVCCQEPLYIYTYEGSAKYNISMLPDQPVGNWEITGWTSPDHLIWKEVRSQKLAKDIQHLLVCVLQRFAVANALDTWGCWRPHSHHPKPVHPYDSHDGLKMSNPIIQWLILMCAFKIGGSVEKNPFSHLVLVCLGPCDAQSSMQQAHGCQPGNLAGSAMAKSNTTCVLG